MFMQQFCGVNVIAYYSSQIFLDGGFSPISALSASLGFGLVNWLFAIPAIYTIDTFGRRNLLLTTFPLVSTFRARTCPFYLLVEQQYIMQVRDDLRFNGMPPMRRLTVHFQQMSLFMFFTGFSFFIPDETSHTARIAWLVIFRATRFKYNYANSEKQYSTWHLSFRCLLLARRRPGSVYVLSRSIPPLCQVLWNVIGNSHNLVLQFRALHHMA